MVNAIEAAIRDVFLGAPANTIDEGLLRPVVDDLMLLGCGDLANKLSREGKGKRASGGFGDLMAELRMARALARHLGGKVDFNIGDAADLRFVVGGVDCLVEVKHERSPSPWSELFHPDPVDIPGMAEAEPWKQAGYRFHSALRTLPVDVQPWLGQDFLKERYEGIDRVKQETSCGEVAAWLAEKLAQAVRDGVEKLQHPTLSAKFELRALSKPPGLIRGYGGVDAWFLEQGNMRAAIKKKSEKAVQRLSAASADCYLIGVVSSSVPASLGCDLQDALLGPSISSGGQSFRSMPKELRPLFDQAMLAGRGPLLEEAALRIVEQSTDEESGLFFEADTAAVSGVLALYYTEQMQFVPNPFSSNEIRQLCKLFPSHLLPFIPGAGVAVDSWGFPRR
jgi:hypothetical protein